LDGGRAITVLEHRDVSAQQLLFIALPGNNFFNFESERKGKPKLLVGLIGRKSRPQINEGKAFARFGWGRWAAVVSAALVFSMPKQRHLLPSD
jgi:hypothetical protein